MIIMSEEKKDSDVVEKFHITQPNFDIDSVYKVKSYIRRNIGDISFTNHFSERKTEKHIPYLPPHIIIKYGRVFEIKTIRGMLYRMAIRIRGKYGDDIVYILQPKFVSKDKIDITYVSAYKNNHDDVHSTLRSNLYK